MSKPSNPDSLDVVRLSPGSPVNITSAGSHPFILHTDLEQVTGSLDAEAIATTATTAFDRSLLINVPNTYAYLDLWVAWDGTYSTAPDVTVFGACTPRRVGQGQRYLPFDAGVNNATDVDRWWGALEDSAGNASLTLPTTKVVENGAIDCTAPTGLHLRGATQIVVAVTSAATGTALESVLMGRFYS